MLCIPWNIIFLLSVIICAIVVTYFYYCIQLILITCGIYNMISNIMLVNTASLLLGKTQGYVPVSIQGTFLSTRKYITLFCICFCFKIPYLNVYIVDSLILTSCTEALSLMPEWSFSNTHFLHKAHCSLPVFRNSRQHIRTLGGHFKQRSHHQKVFKFRTRGTK